MSRIVAVDMDAGGHDWPRRHERSSRGDRDERPDLVALAVARRRRCWRWRGRARRLAGAPRRAGARRRAGAPTRAEPRPTPVLAASRRSGADARRRPATPTPAARGAGRRCAPRLPRIDALIDAIAPLRARGAGQRRAGCCAHLPATRRAGSKPFLIEGLNAESGEWEAPAAGPALRRVPGRRAAGQPHRRAQRDRVLRVRAEGAGLRRRASARCADFPDMLDVVARARELDAFAEPARRAARGAPARERRGLVASATSSSTRARHGFVPGAVPGRLVLPSTRGGRAAGADADLRRAGRAGRRPDHAAVRELTLAFDVPQTTAAAEPFAAWQAAAQALADGMDAALVDDHGQPLSCDGFAAIGKRARALYGALEARDLAAGSAAARRLFS